APHPPSHSFPTRRSSDLTRVETVSCPNSVDGLTGERSSMKVLFSAFGQYALRTTLDDNDGNEMCQGVERAINVARACNLASFVRSEEHTSELQSPYDLVC